MPNIFGSSGGGFPLVDPRCVIEHRERFRRDCFPELERANSYYSLSGRWPDVGWLLLDRASYDQIQKYSTSLRLEIDDFINPPLSISNLSIVQARCVTRGIEADPNAVYLIQVTNGQGVIYNEWFQQPINAQYNVRAPAYDNQYYSASLNSGSPWTWSTMIGDLWTQASSRLGSYPGLPSTPLSTPENFIFVGVPLWETITRILNYLGFTIAGTVPNLTIVESGGTDTAFTAQQTLYSKYLEDDMEYIDGGSGRVPGTVVVYFHTRYQYYGQEETVRRDSLQCQSNSVYPITINAPSTFSSAVGVGHIWDSFTVRYDINGSPLAADVTQANLIAAERAQQYYNTIFRGTLGFMKQVYAGVLPFQTGSLVDGVRWYNHGNDGRQLTRPEDRSGWRTEIIRGYIWPEATFAPSMHGVTGTT